MPSILMANLNVLNKSKLIDLLGKLNLDDPVDSEELDEHCRRNLSNLDKTILANVDYSIIDIEKYNSDDTSSIWKYLNLNLILLCNLGRVLEESDLLNPLNVQDIKKLKYYFRYVIDIGISSNVLPNLPHYSRLVSNEDVCIFNQYKRLVATTYGIFTVSKFYCMKQILIPYYLKWILIAFYQIIYCPIKQPSNVPDENGFIMTQEIYDTLMNNRLIFRTVLDDFAQSVHSVSYIRETMILGASKNTPKWLTRAISATLTGIIRKPKGVEHVAWAMLDAVGVDDNDDITKSWQTLDVVGKIIMQTTKFPDFKTNIGTQVNNLLHLKNYAGKFIKPFENMFAICSSLLFNQNPELCQDIFIKHLLDPLTWFTNEAHVFSVDEDLLEIVLQRMRILQSLLNEESFYIPLVPNHLLDSVLNVIFRLYVVTYRFSDLKEFHSDVKVVLLKCVQELNTDEKFRLFDLFLFDFVSNGYLKFRNDIEILVQHNCLKVKSDHYFVGLRTSHKSEALMSLITGNTQEVTLLFCYFINCLNYPEKYFDRSSINRDLLHLETEVTLDEVSDRKIAVYKLLSCLSENSDIQNYINENPIVIIEYIKTTLYKNIENKVHETKKFESDDFQNLFLMVMLCQALTDKVNSDALDQFQVLVPQLDIIKETNNLELKMLTKDILLRLRSKISKGSECKNEPMKKSKLEEVMEFICDPLLPVRGHGLMELAKLVETKDKSALERKNYVLNIFQQNLKNEDSFIYLSSINGLAALADMFPDTVLIVLCDEYSMFSSNSEDAHEVRIKIGEVLVRVVKRLGEMAPLYKALLLNTFLIGTKDDDHLVRASSLSNLGEICRVLGYKLGTIISEVLVCIHAIITTDKMIEPRRAAVTVIRQLFVGLEKEMIVFLKDEILHLYRTLKNIYKNDHDNVMRLQAQLALEQLNENMKDLIVPDPQLHYEKKIVILDSK